jgi:fibronectin type 3 domain-containing protein
MRPFLSFFVVSFLAGAISFSGCSSDKKSAGFGAPKNLSATDGSYIDQVKISWSSVNGAEKYVVYRCDTVDGTYAEIGTTSNTYFSDIEASSGTVYYYSAKAWSSSDGYSGFSNNDSGSAGTLNNLSAPVINVVSGTSSITVSWNSITGAEKYYIYRLAPTDYDYTMLDTTIGVSYTDSSASQGINYNYKVRAWSGSGFSDPSSVGSGIISPAISTPSSVSATQTDKTKITVSWAAVSYATSYTLRRSDSFAGTYSVVATGITTVSYDDSLSGLEHGLNYYYTVQAVGSSGSSAESSPISGFSPYAYSAPELSVTSGASINLSWIDNGSGSYDVYRSTNSSSGYSKITTVSGSGTISYTDTDGAVASGTTYYYKVRAVAASINVSAFSNAVSAYKGSASGAPASPAGLSATGSTSDISMYWTASSGATGYYVYYSSDGVNYTKSSGITTLPTSGSPLPFSTAFGSAPVNGVTYWIKVSAYNASAEGAPCSPVIATRILVLGQPTVSATASVTTVAGAASEVSVSLSIGASANATGSTKYYVYRSLSSGGIYSEIGNTGTALFNDATVSASTSYYYKIRAYDPAYGYSALSTEGSVLTPSDPAKPAAPSVTTNQASTITVTWSSVASADYFLYRSDTSGIFSLVFSGSGTTYTDSAITVGADYYYKIQTRVSSVYSPLSDASSAGTTAALPGPSDSRASDGTAADGSAAAGNTAQINLWFASVAGATDYYVYRSTAAGGPYIYVDNVVSPTVTYANLQTNGLAYGVDYYFKIKAYDSSTGRFSLDSADNSGYLQLVKPSVSATSGLSAGEVYVSWGAVTGSTSYYVCYKNSSGVIKTDNATNISGTSTTLTGLNPAQTYYLASYAVNSAQTNAASDLSVEIGPVYPKLAAPTGVTAVPGSSGGTVQVSWTGSGGATSYKVCYKTSSGVVKTDNPTVLSSGGNISGLDPAQTYYFNVYALNAGTTASDSALASGEASSFPRLGVPSITAISPGASAGTIDLSWSAVTGASSYYVCYKTAGGVTKTDNVTSVSGTNTTITGLAPGTQYYFAVYAVNAGTTANDSALSAESSCYPRLGAPTISTIIPGSSAGTIDLSWGSVTGASSYFVCYKSSSGVAKTDNATSLSGTNTTISGLNPSLTYYFAVYAINAGTTANDGVLSAEAGPAYPKLAAPTGVSAVPGATGGAVTVTWTGSSGATGYKVCYSTTTPVTKTDNPTTLSSGSDITGLDPSQTYYFNVYAVNGGTTGSDSALAAADVSSRPLLSKPTFPAAVSGPSAGSVTVSWTGSTGATSYKVCYGTSTPVTKTDNPTTLSSGGNITGLNPSSQYYFAVYALNSGTTATDSLLSSEVTAYPTLAAPTGLSAVPGVTGGAVTVTWTGSAGATSYKVCYSTTTPVTKTDNPTTLSSGSDITGLDPSQTYYFNVYAINSASSSADSALAAADVSSLPLLAKPTFPAAVSGSSAGTVTVSWTGSTGATSYKVCYSTSTPVTKTDNPTTLTSGSDITGLDPSYQYYFAVYAINGGTTATDSLLSSEVTAYPTLAAPTGVTAVPGSTANTVKVSWTGSSGATSYKVCFKASSGVVKTDNPVTSTSGADVTVPDTSQTYYFNVYAVNSASSSANSSLAVTEAGPAYRKLAATSLSFTSSDASSITVSWTAVTGATSYHVCYNTSGSVVKTDNPVLVSGTGAAIPGLSASTTYYLNIYPVNGGTTASDGALGTEISASTTP